MLVSRDRTGARRRDEVHGWIIPWAATAEHVRMSPYGPTISPLGYPSRTGRTLYWFRTC